MEEQIALPNWSYFVYLCFVPMFCIYLFFLTANLKVKQLWGDLQGQIYPTSEEFSEKKMESGAKEIDCLICIVT